MFNILIYGLSVAVVGIAVVFVALAILIGMIMAMQKVISRITASDFKFSLAGVKKALGNVSLPGAAAKATPIVIDTTAMGNEEVVAAITAAIATVLEEEAAASGVPAKDQPTFVVRSIRRISNAPAWNRAGREEQVYSRM